MNNNRLIRLLAAGIVLAAALPAFADRDDDDGWRHHRHRHHHHDHGYYRDPPCRIEGWQDSWGEYHERRVCRERVVVPGPAVYAAPAVAFVPPPAIVVRPPSLVVQPPGIFLR